MAKAKNPKFGISFLTNSFQICRPKKASSMIISPLPRASSSSYMLSPLNSKTFDISFPGTPLPPPSSPSKIAPLPVDCGLPSSLPRNQDKILYKSSYSSSSDDDQPADCRASAPCTNKKKDKTTKYKPKSCLRSRISSSGDDTDDQYDSLFSSSPRSSHHPLKTVYEEEHIKGSRKQTTTTKPRRFRRYGSKDWSREGEECDYNEKKPMLRKKKLAPVACKSDDESFVVVKKSVDPYEDFKKSMSEMIMEKQIYEPKELEHLLMSFLSLNSRLHHKIIIQAFTQILKEVFC